MSETGTGSPFPEAAKQQIVHAGYSREQVWALGKEDLNFFAALCMPEIFEHFFPDIHKSVWQLLREKIHISLNDFSKLALGLPRGHAKTTLIKLFVLYCILYTDRNFIVIVCANSSLAENFLADVIDVLNSNNIKSVFGDWTIAVEKNEAGLKKFSFLGRDIILAATGKGSVRGLNIKNRRPDVIVMDDMQTKEDSESPTQADKDLSWMTGTLMKLKNPKRCLYIYIGNMYHSPGCILRKLKTNKNWISFIVGAILADGNAIWPELHSIENLMAEFENDVSLGKPEIFFSEVMNDPDAGVSSLFSINLVPQNPYENDPVCVGKFIIIDVAGDKLTSDDTTIALYGLYGADVVMQKLKVGSFNPRDCIVEALTLAMQEGATVIGVEAVAYQSSMLFWFGEISREIGLEGIHFVPLMPRGVPKNHRIIQWFKRLLPSRNPADQALMPPREYLSTEVRGQVLFQASQFKPMRRDNVDDILDNGAYAEQMVELYGAWIAIPVLNYDPDVAKAKVVENNYAA